MYKLLIRPVKANADGTAVHPTLSLRAVESSCVHSGFSREQVKIAHPKYLEKVVNEKTKVLGLSVHDPMGIGPATTTWTTIFGGVPRNRIEFLKIVNRIQKLKEKYGFKFVVGGTGGWQLDEGRLNEFGTDHLVMGEGELVVPDLFHSIVDGGNSFGRIIEGDQPQANQIPPLLGPTNCDLIEITRGCGRGCKFCAPNVAGGFRSLPLDKITEDVRTYVNHGIKSMIFHSEDTFRYGSSTLLAEKEALLNLHNAGFEAGAKRLFMTHSSLVTFAYQTDVVEALTKLLNKHGIKYNGSQPGLETGSHRLMGKHMRGKMYPTDPEEWHDVVLRAFKEMKRLKWYSVCTLIMGLPEENLDDIKMTIQLMEELKEYPSFFIPLFFVPMSMTSLADRQSFIANNMFEEHWDLMLKCWLHNCRHMHAMYEIAKHQGHLQNVVFLGSFMRYMNIWLRIFIEIGMTNLKSKTPVYPGLPPPLTAESNR
jgi:radical SAM superfamily enzyme YgiQ (UPF0313 family)